MQIANRSTLALLGLLFSFILTNSMDAGTGPSRYLDRDSAWFSGTEAREVATHILSFQSELGGWPKNTNTTIGPAKKSQASLAPTFDNGATVDELRFLARIESVTHDELYSKAFRRGLDYILKAQYPSGGWPQSYPPDQAYHRHITFNDNAMVNLMRFLFEVTTEPRYSFVAPEVKATAGVEFNRGIQCILRCQIKVDGKLTGWCAQHDEIDYRPRPARAFEPVSLSGSESVGIIRLLMSIDRPDAATIAAVDGAVAWFERSKLTGHRLIEVADDKAPHGKDLKWIEDASAPPMWARFYEIESNRPIFCDRDQEVKYSIAEIGYERRNGYSWLGKWAEKLLEKDYPKWKARNPVPAN